MTGIMDQLEPHVEVARTSDGKCGERYLTANETFQLSQAISLKRIADALAAPEGGRNLSGILWEIGQRMGPQS